jgi:L-aspartate oxidase
MMTRADDVIVVGSGMAGLMCALSLAPLKVTLITKTPRLDGGSSLLAKGGIAAAVGPGDTPEDHARDTLAAGAGLSDPERALQLAIAGEESLNILIEKGIAFDRSLDGTLALAQEAAHGRPRVVHAGGDATGRVMTAALIERVKAELSITVLENTFAWDLLIDDGRVSGLVVFESGNGWVCRDAPSVVLATGGVGMAWWNTTNPAESTGDGITIAARAGAELTDLEFMQFHPTALAVEQDKAGASLPLLTEALRGAGAVLLDESGHRFMNSRHAAAELAPRDVVARAIEQQIRAGHRAFLDLRPVAKSEQASLFPEAWEACRQAHLDPARDLIPVAPAAHYHMGGIGVDDDGRTSLAGLWACGEVASTGIHGANRLASNSLLEAVVYARHVARAVAGDEAPQVAARPQTPSPPRLIAATASSELDSLARRARRTMSANVGVLRCGRSLRNAAATLSDLETRFSQLDHSITPCSFEHVVRCGEVRNLLMTARLISLAAMDREESRGAHYRDDFPRPVDRWRRRQSMSLARLAGAGAQ